MSFLNFRSARRRAKKIVSLRHSRAPSPPTPGSFVSANAGEATRKPQAAQRTGIPQIDVDIAHRPLLASGVLRIRDSRLAARSRDSQGGLLPKSLPDDNGLEQRENDVLTGRIVSEDVTRTHLLARRTPKATPAPIKIPITSHASKVQIQRSAAKSADPLGSMDPGDSPVLDDNSSNVSGTTLPGALIANVWCVQTDQSRDHRQSRRITRLDSATLPSGDYTLMADTLMGDGDSDVPPVPPLLSAVKCQAINDLSKGQSNVPSGYDIPFRNVGKPHRSSTFSHQISPIPELSTPSPSNSVTPDLIKDSSTSADDEYSSQPQTSGSAPSAWSGPTSNSSPPSGEGFTMVLDVLAFPLPNSTLAPEMTESSALPSQEDVPASELNVKASSRLHTTPTEQCRPAGSAVDNHRPSQPRSRPSLSSLNNLILHPATLPSNDERRTSSMHRVSASEGSLSSALPSSLAKVHSHHISRLPSFPESATISTAFTSSGFLSRSDSAGPPSPDFLDNIVIADRSGARRSKHRTSSAQPRSSGEISVDPGSRLSSEVYSPTSALSGCNQTFPETPFAFSPISSSSINFARPSPFPGSTKLVRTRSLRGRSRRVSQKFLIGRSAKTTVGSRTYKNLSKAKLARQSLARTAIAPLSPPVTSVEASSQVPLPPPSPQPLSPSPSPSHVSAPQPPPPVPGPDLPSEEHDTNTPWHPTVDSVAPADSLVAATTLPARTIFRPSDARRIPTRPPLPIGPREPYRSASGSSHYKSHNRFGSNSSVESLSRVMLMGNSSPRSSSSSGSGPKFLTSPPTFKAFTLEAAMWTFTSDDLQTIVSRGIKHSAEPSSIRLLNAQAAFTDVPAELDRLAALQNELKVCYKLQARKRDALHRAAMACVETMGSSSYALRARLQELSETTANLDRIAEELYHARDQAAQLSGMLSVHSGSALAMALRKLHASYLRRVAEIQNLQEQVFDLEAERDEAWEQAQLVARDLDDLNEALRTRDSSPSALRPSNRSSLVLASRVSSRRVSKAGLRSLRASMVGSGRLSYVSSVGTSTPAPAPTSASDTIPPVPPIPRRLSSLNRIITSDLSSNSCSVHPSELSPSSGAQALAQAQADLYRYLGIDDADLRPPPLRRSSVAGSPSAASPGTRDNARRMSDSADCRTRGAGAPNRFQAFLESEPDALLATFHQLDD